MKVILKTDVDNLGRAGEVRDVARGFARNRLIPKGLAVEATPAALRWFEKGKERLAKKQEKALLEAMSTAEKLGSVNLSFSRRVGENEKLFGSVGRSDIVKSLKASGYEIDKSAVQLDSTLKEIGDHEVELRLAPEAVVKIKVSVVARS